MEFSGQYLSYEEYRSLGGTLDLTPFNLLEFESRRQIDKNTHNRLVNGENIPSEVKLCMFNLIDTIQKYHKANSDGKNISHETVGSYSVTYRDIKDIAEQRGQELSDIIVTDLYGVVYNGEHLIYCGV